MAVPVDGERAKQLRQELGKPTKRNLRNSIALSLAAVFADARQRGELLSPDKAVRQLGKFARRLGPSVEDDLSQAIKQEPRQFLLLL